MVPVSFWAEETGGALVSWVFLWSPNEQGPLPGGQDKGSLPPQPHSQQVLGHLLSPALPYTRLPYIRPASCTFPNSECRWVWPS